MRKNRSADLKLLLMLLASFGLSLWLAVASSDYINQYPDSLLKKLVTLMGRLQGGGGIIYLSKEVDVEKGLFFLPFGVLAGISFIIYFKKLKGKITDSSGLGDEGAAAKEYHAQRFQVFKLFLIALPIALMIIAAATVLIIRSQ